MEIRAATLLPRTVAARATAGPARPSRAAGLSLFHRPFWVVVHRWAGLTLASFLVIAGLTGAILPFEEPLTLLTRPHLSRVAAPGPAARPLDAVAIAERVERQTGAAVIYLPLAVPRDHVMRLFVSPRPGRPPPRGDVVWADPYTGGVRLTYTFGGLRDGPENIVPFLYQLHFGYVAGPWGMWTFGVAALIWTFDCFVGFGLTLPSARNHAPARSAPAAWLARWWPAWRVRRTRGYKLLFDLHRAPGLWLWPALLVFAWSGVLLALPQVGKPAVRLAGGAAGYAPPARAVPLAAPPLDRRAAIAAGMGALHELGRRRGFTAGEPSYLLFDATSGTYTLYARTSLDVADEGHTRIWIDGASGRAIHFADPLGATASDRVATWAVMLHMAELWGLPYRIVVSCLGVLVSLLSLGGVLIWWRKRSARRATHRGRPARWAGAA